MCALDNPLRLSHCRLGPTAVLKPLDRRCRAGRTSSAGRCCTLRTCPSPRQPTATPPSTPRSTSPTAVPTSMRQNSSQAKSLSTSAAGKIFRSAAHCPLVLGGCLPFRSAAVCRAAFSSPRRRHCDRRALLDPVTNAALPGTSTYGDCRLAIQRTLAAHFAAATPFRKPTAFCCCCWTVVLRCSLNVRTRACVYCMRGC